MLSLQREKRIRRLHHTFSPDDNPIRPIYFLLYFDSTDSYSIALSSSINNITGQTATLDIHGKRTVAIVVASGTLEHCENEQKRITRQSQKSDDDVPPETLNFDDNEDTNQCSSQQGLIRTYQLSNRQPAARFINDARAVLNDGNCDSDADIDDNENEIDHNDDEIDHQPNRSFHSRDRAGSKNKKRKQPPTNMKKPKRQRKNAENNAGNEQVIQNTNQTTSGHMGSKDILNQIENHLVIFQNYITKKMKAVEKKLDFYLSPDFSRGSKGLDQYRNDKGDVFPTEYLYKNRNLLTTPSKDPVDFARQTLKILFSPEELKTHILPPEREHLKRPALDQQRFNIFMEVLRIKFRLDSDLMQQFFNDVLRIKLSNFLYEERRRESRKRARDQERIWKRNLLQSTQNDYHRVDHQEENEMI